MAITATFKADFNDFVIGVKEAEAKLDALGASSGRAEGKLLKFTGAAASGVGPATTLGTTYRQFDGVLASMGVNIGPQVRGLEDLAAAAQKGAPALGGLAKAGLVAGAAIAGWEIGRWVAEMTGADQMVADLSASLLGYGDVALQTAAAQTDVIVKAIDAGAHSMISYTDAIAFNAAELKKYQAPIEAAGRLQIFETALSKVNAEAHSLSAAQQAMIKESLELGVSTKAIAEGMTVSVDAVDTYAASLDKLATFAKQAADSSDRLAKLDAKSVEETAGLWREFADQQVAMSGTATDARIADINRWRDNEIAKLNTSTADYQKHKDAIVAISKQQADAQGVDWDFLRSQSLEGLQEVADKAKATYDEMRFGSRTFTREALEAQLQKVNETARAATGMGTAFSDGLAFAKQASDALGESLDSLIARGDAARESFVAMGHRTTDASGKAGSDLGKAYGRSLDEFPSKATLIATLRAAGLEDWMILNILLGVATVSDYQATIDKKKEPAPARGSRGADASGGSSGGGRDSLTSGRDGPVVVNVGVTVSGVFDPASKTALAAAVKDEVLKGLKHSRRFD